MAFIRLVGVMVWPSIDAVLIAQLGLYKLRKEMKEVKKRRGENLSWWKNTPPHPHWGKKLILLLFIYPHAIEITYN